jgi:phenylacetate-coenzyme A ligase PaaK-like adenylate-forming protein
MLPKDIWTLKALPCGGTDTSIYKDKIAYYWGIEPYEQYGCTEEGAIATQSWNKKYMTFFPDAAFYEFIPEEEWYKWRSDTSYSPRTVLYNEVKPNKKYELVLTNFYGKPFVRYRTFDLMEFPVLQDTESGINLPQMSFVGRSDDLIDLAGFTGPIDERMVWKAIDFSGIEYKEWAMRKEIRDGEPILRLYIEPVGPTDKETICQKVHEGLKKYNSFYADYEAMIEKSALEVTLLYPGTFQSYMQEKQAMGTDLAHLKPAHMNPSDDTIQMLLKLDETARELIS